MSASQPATTASRYLANQLTAAERAQYETLLTRDVAALAELEATARLKVGLEKLSEKRELPTLLQPSARARWAYALPLAAGVAAVCVGLALWYPNGQVSAPVLRVSASSLLERDGHALPILGSTVIFRRRAATADAVIELPDTHGILEWRWTPAQGAAAAHYDALLMRTRKGGAPEVVGEIAELEADAAGVVKWYVDTAALVSGQYKLKLTGHVPQVAPATPETFLISVRMRPQR